MNTHRVKLKRSPKSVTVGNTTVRTAVTARAANGAKPTPSAAANPTPAPNPTSASKPKTAAAASVMTNPVDRFVTPIARSGAVPVLSGAAHEVVTAEQMGFNDVDPEDIARLKQLLTDAVDEVNELKTQNRQSLGEMQEVAVELATAATSWLVGFAIEKDLFAVDDLVLRALEQLGLTDNVKVRLHPADHDLLKKLIPDSSSQKQLEELNCVRDASLTRGSVRVESGRRILITDMHSRVEDIRRSWMETLDDSQTERRGDGSNSRTLRRFPERRETA